MKIIIAILLVSGLASADEETAKAEEAAFERFRNYTEERNREIAQEVKEHERRNVDGLWMINLFVDYSQNGKKISDADLQRIWEIYERENDKRTHENPLEEKLYAFSLIAEFEDISKWQKEFDSLAFSEDPKFVKTAIGTVIWKLDRGTEREKIILSNKTAVLDRLVKFAEDNKADTTIHRDAVKINDLAKPYIGQTPPAEVQRPDRRPSESPAMETPILNEKTPDSSTVESSVQMIGKGMSLTFAGIIGIFILAILVWRQRLKWIQKD